MRYGPLSLGGLTARELASRVWSRLYSDAAWDTAAQLGYYFLLALFPLVLCLVSLLTILHALNVVDPFMVLLHRLMPAQAFALLDDELRRLTSTPRGDLFTIGAVAALWASSSGVEALLTTLNRAYEVRETRSYVKVRATSILMTFVIAGLFIAGAALLSFGDRLSARIAVRLDEPWVAPLLAAGNFVLGIVLMILGLEVVYYYGPNVANQKWRWVSPGSFIGVLVFVLASSGFSAYVRYSDSYSVMYGSLGAVVILLFWLYILGLALLTGGEINAQVAAAGRAHGEADAPMVGVEGEPPKPGAAAAEPEPVHAVDDPVRELLEAIRREHGHARAALVASLGAAGLAADAAVPDLVVLIRDGHQAVRDAAITALGRIGGAASALPALRELSDDADPAVREAAARAVASIESAAADPEAPEVQQSETS